MKIVIIEDRLGRLEKFAEFDVTKYSEVTVITDTAFDKLIAALEVKNFEELKEYDCIASHRSALTNETRDVIKEFCNANRKPLIFFSGGITSSVYKDVDFPFLHINSKHFYSSNLKLFLDNCRQNNNVNLLMLQFGDRWKLSLLLNLRNRIAVAQNNQMLKNTRPEIAIQEKELIRTVRDLQINKFIKSDLLNDKTESVLNGSDFKVISAEQLNNVKAVIDHLVNGMA